MFKKNEFRAAMVFHSYTVKTLAERLGIDPATLSRKINGHADFSRDEVAKIRKILSLSDTDVVNICVA